MDEDLIKILAEVRETLVTAHRIIEMEVPYHGHLKHLDSAIESLNKVVLQNLPKIHHIDSEI